MPEPEPLAEGSTDTPSRVAEAPQQGGRESEQQAQSMAEQEEEEELMITPSGEAERLYGEGVGAPSEPEVKADPEAVSGQVSFDAGAVEGLQPMREIPTQLSEDKGKSFFLDPRFVRHLA
eukprot:COSAG02_NODE_34702_length_480_cov_0.527559_1_plen_119_part_10